MNGFTRWWEVVRRELRTGLRQPAFWLLCVLMGLIAWRNSQGAGVIWTLESLITGKPPYITSVFNQADRQGFVLLATAPWFLAMTLGLVVIRDIELRIVEVFNSTRLTPREYVWAKFSGGVGFFLIVWGLYLGLSMGFNHIIEGSAGSDLIGPFALGNYLFPTLLIGLPQILLYAGVSFFIGVWTRRPVLVFLFPLVMLLYWLMGWPGWLPQGISDMLALLEPTGRIWIHETFIRGDRSVEFLNTAPLIPDIGFVLSRMVLAGIGLAGVAGAAVSYARRVQTGESGPGLVRRLRGPRATRAEVRPPAEPTLADLGMATRPLGFWKAAATIARGEIRDLLVRPGMYLCVPLILWVTTETSGGLSGPLDLRNLLTPGTVATSHLFDLSLMICFLLLFYTVESLHKERSRRMHEIFGSAPVSTGPVLLGKALGNSVMAAFILGAALLLYVGVFLYKQIAEGSPVGFEFMPFVAAWGAVLLPTFIFWTALVTALFALFRNRYVVYGSGVAVIVYTTFILGDGMSLNWTINWLGASVLQWSDMGAFALHGYPLLLNRLLYLSLVPLLIVLSVRWFGRRDFDATGILSRLRPKPLLLGTLRLFPLAVPAIVLASILAIGGRSGYQGPGAEEWNKEYWSRNIATWNGFRMPSVSQVDLDLDIEPSERSVAVAGAYTFFNHRDYAYDRFPLTAGPWEPIEWTLGGEPYEPEDRAGLYLFTPAKPLEPGDTVTIGFRYDVEVFGGISKTPEGLGKFVLESGSISTASNRSSRRCRDTGPRSVRRGTIRRNTRTTSTWARPSR